MAAPSPTCLVWAVAVQREAEWFGSSDRSGNLSEDAMPGVGARAKTRSGKPREKGAESRAGARIVRW